MPRRTPGRSTVAIHGRASARAAHEPVAPPIFQSSTFVSAYGSTDEVLYTRYGNNPNQLRLAERLAGLEGAEAAIFVASGMGATALAHLAVLSPGDHLLSSEWIYGGTRRLFREEFTRFGIDVSFVNPDRRRDWRSKLRKTTRAIFVESPTNPLMRLLDVEWLATLASSEGIALLVDSTFATPMNYRPLEHGADVVIHSATKYLNGHSDIIAGAVAGAATLVDEVRERMKLWGQALDPHAAWLIERGLKTLGVRMERHNRTGLAVATWLAEQPKVRRVHYPGLASHPDHALAAKVLDGFSGMVGVELAGGARAADRCLRALRLVAHAPSLGGVESLVSEPRFTSHAGLTADERAAAGIPDGFLRLSLGLEDADDLIEDLARGLAAA
ncbi:MAG TPA: aminotransferase class I/II-fold pyridoxal phosphate-dependent enzyme [Gemmatimonadales bacterium]|nr:aminotransferase class I/II-fold pyridoxal phosphate-dependent enzyme [Gemmatimonadales bacterium]